MDSQKFFVYIAAIVIGIGFIMMAIDNTLGNATISLVQGILGIIFILVGSYKSIEEISTGQIE